jgi:hypothetical protein
MEPDSNPAWLPPEGALNVQPYNAANDHRTFIQSVDMLDENDPRYSPRVVVEGKQYVNGRVERWIAIYATGERLSAADACRMAGFLLNAADGLDKHT